MTKFKNDSKGKIYFLFVFTILLAVLICTGCDVLRTNESGPEWPTREFRTSTPERQGVHSEGVAELFEMAKARSLNSLLIMRNGYLIAETYFMDNKADEPHDQYSVTKSITSALVGIAIRDGYIKNTDQKVSDFFPEVNISTDRLKQELAIKHLLNMTSGLRGFDGEKDSGFWHLLFEGSQVSEDFEYNVKNSDDWGSYVFGIEMAHEPGKHFSYDDFHLLVLGSVMQRALGRSMYEYAQEVLFEPLGMTSVIWHSDSNDFNFPGFGISMTSRDMMRFGYMYLRNGMWDGQQIVPGEWIRQQKLMDGLADELAAGYENGYGFMFWLDSDSERFSAAGMSGQYIRIYPDLDMVIVNTSREDFLAERLYGSFINKYVKTLPLKKNTSAEKTLVRTIKNSHLPVTVKLPQLDSLITNTKETYTIDLSSLTLHSIRETGDKATFTMQDQVAVTWSEGDVYRLSTQEKFQFPLKINVQAKTDGTNIRLYFMNGRLILNWENNTEQLRVRDIISEDAGSILYDPIKENIYTDITWILERDYTAVIIDSNVVFYSKDLNYIQELKDDPTMDLEDVVSVSAAWGSTVHFASLTVTELD